jgi:uncharacterized protein YxeA
MKKIIILCLVLIFSWTTDSFAFSKYATEEFYRYHEFKRTDGRGWLTTGEIIHTDVTDYTVKCYDRDTSTETSTTMISDVSVIDGNATRSRVKYKVKDGTAGKSYFLKITIVTSAGQTFIDEVDLNVN